MHYPRIRFVRTLQLRLVWGKNGKGRRPFGKEERIRKGRTFAAITFLSANNTRAHYQPCRQKRKRHVMSAN
jgi:hypothetical protein